MLQFFVLLGIMALWAVTSLLSREAQPLPPRQPRRPGPDPARPSFVPNQANPTTAAHQFGSLDRPASESFSSPRRSDPNGPPRPRPARAPLIDEGIRILEAETRAMVRPGSPPSASGPAGANRRGISVKRTSRSRAASAQPKPAESAKTRALTNLVTESMAQKRNRPLEMAPLSNLLLPSNSPLTEVSTAPRADWNNSTNTATSFTGDSLRELLKNPTKLREVAFLTELLQPPVALRGRRRPR